MPKVLIVCGSCREGGTTREMCQSAAETFRSAGWEVRMSTADGIGHCTGCGACARGACVLRDRMDETAALFSKADFLVLASPVRFSGPSSQMKTILDRFQPYWYRKDLPHPRRAAAMLCGGSDNPEFGHTLSIFRAFSITVGMEWCGSVLLRSTDRGTSEEAREAGRRFASQIVGNGKAI